MSSIFDVFYSSPTPLTNEEVKIENCNHSNTRNENDNIICEECGICIDQIIVNRKDWKSIQTCSYKKVKNVSIIDDVKNMGFSDEIISKADDLFKFVTQGKIYRGKPRKAIIMACIYKILKSNDVACDVRRLPILFGINQRDCNKGFQVIAFSLKNLSSIEETCATPESIICDILKNWETSSDSIDNILNLYKKMKSVQTPTNNGKGELNRARPHSVAAGMVHYYIKLMNINHIKLDDFAKSVNLSPATIIKMATEISRILKTPEIIPYKA